MSNQRSFQAPASGVSSTAPSRYAAALAVFGASLLFRYAFHDSLGMKVPYLQFYPATMLAAWYGGLGPGLLVTVLSSAWSSYFLLPPHGFAVADPADQLSLGVFAATGVVISWLNHGLRAAQRAQLRAAQVATERAERLDASEARWRAIVDSAVDGIVLIDAHGRVEFFNRAAERLFGYASDEVLGRNVDMLMPPPYREEHDGYLSRYLATGRAKIIGIGREVQGRRKDGTTFPLHLSVGEITLQGERKFTGILHDLTKRVEIEGQMREREALAKLGEMAAIIAHEVKNPLAGIRGAIQVFGPEMIRDGADTDILREIVARIDSLDQMMKDLLLFARPPTPKRSPVEINALLKATADLLSADPAFRDIDFRVDGSGPPLQADADMLRVVFQNLIINAAHAMQGRGRIRVDVRLIDSTFHIVFADAGPGIPLEIRQKIFTPFFTTKSRGSGLGLATVKRFVEAHHGDVDVDCPPDGGTTVRIRIPAGVS
jgi:two-component system sensor kinase FixL